MGETKKSGKVQTRSITGRLPTARSTRSTPSRSSSPSTSSPRSRHGTREACSPSTTHRRGHKTKMTSAIDPACLPVPQHEAKKTCHRALWNNRPYPHPELKSSLDTAYVTRWQSDPVQLAEIYCNVREKAQLLSPEGAVDATLLRYLRPSLEREQAVTEVVHQMCEAVALQPAIQDLKTRIVQLPLRNRPLPSSIDEDVLGIELKIRLAARAPVLTTSVDPSTGLTSVTESKPRTREIPIYEIDNEDDATLTCYMKLKLKNKKYSRRSVSRRREARRDSDPEDKENTHLSAVTSPPGSRTRARHH